ncbi:FadR family transcriptional regulator [Inquilinus limosus]|uniref:FadR/GntR family transcriptional regulator n=1 Tax=Inquilinus limosus TaxID=171674 RepID=UPI003F172364
MSARPRPTLLPVRTPTRDEAALAAIAEHVERAGIKPGERLPPERELAEQLQVSRSTIREALKRWEGLGVVEMRKGSGTYLKVPVSTASIHMPLTIDRASDVATLLHTLEVRRALEGEAAAICARRATPEQIAEIGRRLDIMEAHHRKYGDAPEQDWEFHQSIFRATENPIFGQILASMRDAFHRFWENPLDMPDFAGRTFPYHRVMYDAIVRRDPDGARNAALTIIDMVDEDIRDADRRRGQTR